MCILCKEHLFEANFDTGDSGCKDRNDCVDGRHILDLHGTVCRVHDGSPRRTAFANVNRVHELKIGGLENQIESQGVLHPIIQTEGHRRSGNIDGGHPALLAIDDRINPLPLPLTAMTVPEDVMATF